MGWIDVAVWYLPQTIQDMETERRWNTTAPRLTFTATKGELEEPECQDSIEALREKIIQQVDQQTALTLTDDRRLQRIFSLKSAVFTRKDVSLDDNEVEMEHLSYTEKKSRKF